MDENGKITSQGQDVDKVLVDGDEFFGADPTIATKNLGAKGVEEVQVYEMENEDRADGCLLYTSPSPRDQRGSRMPSSA